MLTVQQDAPDFTLDDAHGTQHQLSDYKSQWVVLYFYPKDNTPGCTTEACNLRDDHAEFAKISAKIIGISTDTSQSHLKFTEKRSLPFTLLADTHGEVSKSYDALFKLGPLKVSKRHSFIIDPTGKIAKTYRSVSPNLHSQELLVDLQQLQKTFK